ncbi:MAG: hypothetical protein K2Q01_08990 [Rickettsiales bacterium]|nr:hypothetical protein [Rickettsiales bacterium]
MKHHLLPLIAALLLSAPASAQEAAPEAPTGATFDDAKEAIGSEFNPSKAMMLELPKADPRFTNNPALNKLIAPEEKTAPSLAEQDEKEIEEDYKASIEGGMSPERAEEMKQKAREEKRRQKKLQNPGKKRKSLNPEEDEAQQEKEKSGNPKTAPKAKRASSAKGKKDEEEDSGLPPLVDPEKENKVKERDSEDEFGVEKTDKGVRYMRPSADTKAGKGEEKEAATKAGRPSQNKPEVEPRGKAERPGAKAEEKGSKSGGKGAKGGKKNGKKPPPQPKPEQIKPEEEEVEKLFDKLNE